ncbi:hypothetical protein AGMMS50239_03660 [Bacteroidia bacterium]|nr:hypothetical protein AGMMS50239_03660 [Bacteroidia bacterium]
MKTKLFLLMLFAASTLSAQNQLTVVIDGIEKIKGQLFIAVYNEENFRKKPIDFQIKKVENETITIVFDSIPPGKYALSAFHDENSNNQLDTGTFGIPTEKYGFSNNARGKMGPPAFKDCMIKVEEEDTVIYITLM